MRACPALLLAALSAAAAGLLGGCATPPRGAGAPGSDSVEDSSEADRPLAASLRPDGARQASTSGRSFAIVLRRLPEGRLGRDYRGGVPVVGGTPPLSVNVVEGELPEGLSLSQIGRFHGSPMEAGTFPVTVEAVDSGAPPQAVSAELELVVPRVILLSGYGPFEGFPVNPSWEAVRVLDGERYGDFEVRAFSLKVVWDEASNGFLDRIEGDLPAVAIASGVAGGRREAFSLERTAQNLEVGMDVEDNSRNRTPCVPGAPATLRSTLPFDAIADALSEAGIHWEYSDDAGTYLCNHLFYSLMHATAETDIRAGFIHVSDQYATIEDLTAGWRVILQAIADELADP